MKMGPNVHSKRRSKTELSHFLIENDFQDHLNPVSYHISEPTRPST
ncbi:hypothetical protein ACQ4LK_21910 [Bacillus pumilus]